jgi:hypothetical protein
MFFLFLSAPGDVVSRFWLGGFGVRGIIGQSEILGVRATVLAVKRFAILILSG